jgi:hypothetical protein
MWIVNGKKVGIWKEIILVYLKNIEAFTRYDQGKLLMSSLEINRSSAEIRSENSQSIAPASAVSTLLGGEDGGL